MAALFGAMPKVELHMHLDGAVEPGTAAELAALEGLAGIEGLSYEGLCRRMIIGGVLSCQEELLGYYDLPVALLQSERALCRVTEDLILSKAADNVRYCEIRWAPGLHTRKGLSVGQAAAAVMRTGRRAGARAGVEVRFIAVGMRGDSPAANIDMLRQALAADVDGVLAAADLAGNEREWPDPARHLAFFEEARRMGLSVTFHCGELPGSAGMLARAAERLAPDRIAHGAPAVQDAGLCRFLAGKGIQLDLCPTSNIQAGLYRSYMEFPLKALHERGVPLSISTDSPVISGRTLSEEYCAIAENCQMPFRALWQINLASIERIFAPEEVKRRLRDEFRQWAASRPELA
jgi:adenosine deaminase